MCLAKILLWLFDIFNGISALVTQHCLLWLGHVVKFACLVIIVMITCCLVNF